MTGKHLWVFQAREIEEFGKEVTLEQNCSWKINEACVSYSTKENGLFCPSFDWTPLKSASEKTWVMFPFIITQLSAKPGSS